MPEPIPITDPEWRRAVDEALERVGELVALVMYTSSAGSRDWFVVQDQGDLEEVLAKVGVMSPVGRSDAISLLATREFPYRGRDVEALVAAAREIASRSWVILGCKHDDDPQLHDVEAFEADEVKEIEDWFREPREGELFVGEDPYVVERGIWPGGAEFFAYGVRPDGTVLPGAY